jgi:hypothetical protein
VLGRDLVNAQVAEIAAVIVQELSTPSPPHARSEEANSLPDVYPLGWGV